MAYTFGKETVRVDLVVWWIAEHGCPEEFRADQRKTVKRVREAIQHAFSTGQLPGSDGIQATKKGRLPSNARLEAPEFFTWAVDAKRWPVLREQEGIPLLGSVGTMELVLPRRTLDAFSVDTPQDLTELQKRHIAAETKAYQHRLGQEKIKENLALGPTTSALSRSEKAASNMKALKDAIQELWCDNDRAQKKWSAEDVRDYLMRLDLPWPNANTLLRKVKEALALLRKDAGQ